jgi:acyl carrier protein
MILSRLENIFQDIFDSPSLHIGEDTAPPNIPDWDSVAQVKLVLATEEHFGIGFTTDEVASLKKVGDFIRVLKAKGLSD